MKEMKELKTRIEFAISGIDFPQEEVFWKSTKMAVKFSARQLVDHFLRDEIEGEKGWGRFSSYCEFLSRRKISSRTTTRRDSESLNRLVSETTHYYGTGTTAWQRALDLLSTYALALLGYSTTKKDVETDLEYFLEDLEDGTIK